MTFTFGRDIVEIPVRNVRERYIKEGMDAFHTRAKVIAEIPVVDRRCVVPLVYPDVTKVLHTEQRSWSAVYMIIESHGRAIV
jgi:hypothetical protein